VIAPKNKTTFALRHLLLGLFALLVLNSAPAGEIKDRPRLSREDIASRLWALSYFGRPFE
jgi:hypothetical protein